MSNRTTPNNQALADPKLTLFEFSVREFSIASGRTWDNGTPDDRRTHYVDEPDLKGKVSEYPNNVGAAVLVEIDVDEGNHHTVRLDCSTAESERFDMLTRAADEILRVRDQLLKMHGYASYEEWSA